MNLTDTERAAAERLAAALGSVLVVDVDVAPVRAAAPAWDTPSAKPGTCTCCGKRRDLVAFTDATADRADLCFRCGSDQAQGLGYCSSKPGTYTHTFSDSDWTVEQ